MRMLVDYEVSEPLRAELKAQRSLGEAIQKNQRSRGDITGPNHFVYKTITMTRRRFANG